jgi:hypothetical protein
MRKMPEELDSFLESVLEDLSEDERNDFHALLTLHMAGVYGDGYDAGLQDGAASKRET